ncbi:MAG: ribbon-helix-helix domain-containing protein [Acidimicrobiales bacterium]
MTQVAVKLPESLVREVDELVARGIFPSRSSVIRRGLEALIEAQRRQAVALAYERGYQSSPESEGELAEATRLAVAAVHDEPWERWW